MYDPLETDISLEYLKKLASELSGSTWALLGGWGTYFMVNSNLKAAFGREYLRSRDIDLFIHAKEEPKLLAAIHKLGFWKSAYPFRYELIIERETKKAISEAEAKAKPVFSVVYLFLDVFSDGKTKQLGSWEIPTLRRAKISIVDGLPLISIDGLLALKSVSFFEREKLDKELKDACDIFALLCYSGTSPKINELLRKAIEKISNRPDLQSYIADNVLGDVLKASLVAVKLRPLLG